MVILQAIQDFGNWFWGIPILILIGGGVARAGDVLFDPLVEHFKTYAFKSCRETPIKAASLGNDAGIYGAVRLIVGE